MSKPAIGIDPGSSSGAVAACGFGKITVANLCTNELWNLYEQLRVIKEAFPYAGWYIEDVGGSMPGNAAKSARTFATHMGHLEMALAILRIPAKKVSAATWMKVVVPDRPKNPKKSEYTGDIDGDSDFRKACAAAKKARKDFIYETVKQRFPDTKITKRQADAVAIMMYGQEKENGSA